MKKLLRKIQHYFFGHPKQQRPVQYRVICQSFGDNRAERRMRQRSKYSKLDGLRLNY